MITLFILIYLVLECIGDYFILYLLYCVIDWRSSHVYVHNIVAKKKKKKYSVYPNHATLIPTTY